MEVKALITRKIGMSSIINDDGTVTPVTLLSATPNTVVQIKTVDNDGYNALQMGFETAKKLVKPLLGHAKQSKVSPKVIREFCIDEITELMKVGAGLNVDSFILGDVVDVVGTSKGKGFAGTIKRHNFHRQRKTHGGKGNTRKVGSIGSMYPQKIFKGKKMSGQMGSERVTIKNQKVAMIDMQRNIIGISGAIPGPKSGIVLIKGVRQPHAKGVK